MLEFVYKLDLAKHFYELYFFPFTISFLLNKYL